MVPKPGSAHNLGASSSRGERQDRRQRRSRSPPVRASTSSRQSRSSTSHSSSTSSRQSRASSRLRSTVHQVSSVRPRDSSNRRSRSTRSRSHTPTRPSHSRRFRSRSRSLRTRSRTPQRSSPPSSASENRTPVFDRLGGRSASSEPPPTTSRQVAVRYAPTDPCIPTRGPDARANREVAETNVVNFQTRLRELRSVDQLTPDDFKFTVVIPVSDQLLQEIPRRDTQDRRSYGDRRRVRY